MNSSQSLCSSYTIGVLVSLHKVLWVQDQTSVWPLHHTVALNSIQVFKSCKHSLLDKVVFLSYNEQTTPVIKAVAWLYTYVSPSSLPNIVNKHFVNICIQLISTNDCNNDYQID